MPLPSADGDESAVGLKPPFLSVSIRGKNPRPLLQSEFVLDAWRKGAGRERAKFSGEIRPKPYRSLEV